VTSKLTEAQRIYQDAIFPKNRLEERFGIEPDVVAMRIMMADGSSDAKREALRRVLRDVGRTAIRGGR
jgi:hypothetical protein